MRRFKILKWPESIKKKPNLRRYFSLVKELRDYARGEQVYCLDVDGNKIYFYPNEVKEVTDEKA